MDVAFSETPSNGRDVRQASPRDSSPGSGEKDTWWQSLRRWIPDRLWGYDFFVSYHWESGGSYAVNLAQRLRDRKYDVFLDRSEYAAGDNWVRIGRHALRHTQRLILVATREAIAQSRPVAREVEFFTAGGKRVVPIVFGSRFSEEERESFPILAHLPESILDIVEMPERRLVGPSDSALDRLISVQRLLRRRSLRALVVGVVLSILTVALLVTAWQYGIAEARRIDSESKRLAALANSLGPTRPDLAAILGVQAHRVTPTKEAEASVLGAVLREPRLICYLTGQVGHVDQLVFSPDGRVLGSGNDEGIIVLWQVGTGQVLGTFRNRHGRVGRMAISPDSSRVAAGFVDGTILLWDYKNGRPDAWKPFGQSSEVEELAFSGDGAYLLARAEGQVLRYHLATKAPTVSRILETDERISQVVLLTDGKGVMAGSGAGVVYSYDAASGLRRELIRLDEPVTALALDEGSGRWAVGTDRGRIVVQCVDLGTSIELRKADGREVKKIRLCEGGSILAAELDGEGSRLVAWRVGRDPVAVDLDHPTLLHDFAFDKSGAHLVSAGLYSKLIVHDPLGGKQIGVPLVGHGQQVYCVAFAPGAGAIVASSGDEGNVILWDILRTSRLAASATPGTNLPSTVEGVAFSTVDDTIAGGGGDAMLFIQPVGPKKAMVQSNLGQMQFFRQLRFSADGTLLVAGGEADGLVLFRRRRDWEYEFVATGSNVEAITMTRDEKAVRVVDGGGVIRTFSTANGKETGVLKPALGEDRDRGAMFSAAFRSDGAEAALGYQGGELFVVSAIDGTILQRGKRRATVSALAYSPDGATLASSAENSIELTVPGTDRLIGRILDRHPSAVNALAFSSDGGILAAGCVDGTILLFDVRTKQKIGAIPAHSATVYALAFHPRTHLLLSGGADRRALIFNLKFEALRAEARRIAGRNLSLDEWNQYMGSGFPYQRTFPDLPDGEGAPLDGKQSRPPRQHEAGPTP